MTTTRDETYEAIIEGVSKEYGPKAMALLCRVRDVCREAGLTTDDKPYDMSCDDYRWSLSVYRASADPDVRDEDCIDVSVTISEAREYDGGEDSYGVNFSLDIVGWGGLILGGLAPYNYTTDCWVDAGEETAVADRWRLIAEADISTIPDLVERKEDS